VYVWICTYICILLNKYIVISFSFIRGKTATEAADDIITNHLPKLKELGRQGELHVDNIDVFCEKGVFDLDSTRRILQSGKEMGLQINFHGDELHPMKAAEVGLTLAPLSIRTCTFMLWKTQFICSRQDIAF
jgi:imidazolonepropionase-like amidohydrolase